MSNAPKDAPTQVRLAISNLEGALAELRAVQDPDVASEVLALRTRAANQKMAKALGALSPVLAATVDPNATNPILPITTPILDALKESGLSAGAQRTLERIVSFSKQPVSSFRDATNGPVVTIADLARVPQSSINSASFRGAGKKTVAEIVSWAAAHGVVMPERPTR